MVFAFGRFREVPGRRRCRARVPTGGCSHRQWLHERWCQRVRPASAANDDIASSCCRRWSTAITRRPRRGATNFSTCNTCTIRLYRGHRSRGLERIRQLDAARGFDVRREALLPGTPADARHDDDPRCPEPPASIRSSTIRRTACSCRRRVPTRTATRTTRPATRRRAAPAPTVAACEVQLERSDVRRDRRHVHGLGLLLRVAVPTVHRDPPDRRRRGVWRQRAGTAATGRCSFTNVHAFTINLSSLTRAATGNVVTAVTHRGAQIRSRSATTWSSTASRTPHTTARSRSRRSATVHDALHVRTDRSVPLGTAAGAAGGSRVLCAERSGRDQQRSRARATSSRSRPRPSNTLQPTQNVVIAGVTIACFNGTFTVATTPSATTFTFVQAAADAASSGGTAAHAAMLYKYQVQTKVIGFGVTPGDTNIEAIAHAGGAADMPGDEGYYANDDAGLELAISTIVAKSLRSESCNNLDDDCDTLIDEDFPTKGNPCNNGEKGVCLVNGHQRLPRRRHRRNAGCTAASPSVPRSADGTACNVTNAANAWSPASAPAARSAIRSLVQSTATEICNGLDDDCDGLIDEGLVGCTCSPQAEICDGVDQDCDNHIDQSCRCSNDNTHICKANGDCGGANTCVCTPLTETCGTGTCLGTQTCVGGVYTGCTATPTCTPGHCSIATATTCTVDSQCPAGRDLQHDRVPIAGSATARTTIATACATASASRARTSARRQSRPTTRATLRTTRSRRTRAIRARRTARSRAPAPTASAPVRARSRAATRRRTARSIAIPATASTTTATTRSTRTSSRRRARATAASA